MSDTNPDSSIVAAIIRFFLQHGLIALFIAVAVSVGGISTAPFDWSIPFLPRSPVAVDAIPDLSENQQIVFTEWGGRSPQDVEDQVTYPLTAALLGLPKVKAIRSYSHFGYSSIYVIFQEQVDFYWGRARILEKLASLREGDLPSGVRPALGPDATALGQAYWYTIEGRNKQDKPAGGWDPSEIRSVQDWTVRFALQSVEGVAEVSSIGGFVKEYQIDVDPDALHAYKVDLSSIIKAVKNSNIDVGARTIEINKVEYVIRGLGFIRSIKDLENTVIKLTENNIPVYLRNVARINLGPGLRRGALDKDGSEAVGGVVVVRYGENPLSTLKGIKAKIREISNSLPEKVLPNGQTSKLTIVPFYDRSTLIKESLGTLHSALGQQLLITVAVTCLILFSLPSSIVIACTLPLAILMTFIFMKLFSIDANIIALAGIAIALGTMVDTSIVLCQNIIYRLKDRSPEDTLASLIYRAALEVSAPVLTAIFTTLISFLPILTLEATEGRLFRPLAYTKSFALLSALIIAFVLIPSAMLLLTRYAQRPKHAAIMKTTLLITIALWAGSSFPMLGLSCALLALWTGILPIFLPPLRSSPGDRTGLQEQGAITITVLCALWYLTEYWMPFGPEVSYLLNFTFIALTLLTTLFVFRTFEKVYPSILGWCLDNKRAFAIVPITLILTGGLCWTQLKREFMPSLNEGSFLFMPSTMPHASIGESLDQLSKIDKAITSIPEIDTVVGKLGRVNSALDPAPISMFENIVNYKPEYRLNEDGRIIRFRYDHEKSEFKRSKDGALIPDEGGLPFRQWRPEIQSTQDIWNEIIRNTNFPGLTGSPKLQPIEARLAMLQSGIRAPLGIKIKGATLEDLQIASTKITNLLQEVPSVRNDSIIPDQVIGKPYIEIGIRREDIARHGLLISDVQEIIEVAIGGKPLTTTVEGRERYNVRIRYPRELRDSIEDLGRILVPAPSGHHIPLQELASITFSRQAQVIKGEDTFQVAYIAFEGIEEFSETAVIQQVKDYIESRLKSGKVKLPAGTTVSFAGTYENQLRSEKRLAVIIPFTLLIIFAILYIQFKSPAIAGFIFSSVLVAWSGGFVLLWLYSQSWFLDINLLGWNLRESLGIHPYNLSVAVWVGFLTLFGIATDDGVLICQHIEQNFEHEEPTTETDIRASVITAGTRRIKPALMTTATTLLSLLPIMSSQGKGSEVLIPMAIPAFGGMIIALVTVFIVPVLICWKKEKEITSKN